MWKIYEEQNNRIKMEESISKLDVRSMEVIQSEE